MIHSRRNGGRQFHSTHNQGLRRCFAQEYRESYRNFERDIAETNQVMHYNLDRLDKLAQVLRLGAQLTQIGDGHPLATRERGVGRDSYQNRSCALLVSRTPAPQFLGRLAVENLFLKQ